MKYIAFFLICLVSVEMFMSVEGQRARGRGRGRGRGRCRADTSLTEKSLSRNAIRQVEQQVSQSLGTSPSQVKVTGVEFNAYCGCTQLTFEMQQQLIQAFQRIVQSGSFSINVNRQPVYINSLAVISGSGASSPSSGSMSTVKIQTSITTRVQLNRPMMEQLQVQLSTALSRQTGQTSSIRVESVDFDSSCGCTAVTLKCSSELVQVLQSLIQNGYSVSVNGNNIALTSITVVSSSGGGRSNSVSSPSSNSVQSGNQFGVVETSLSESSITQSQAAQIVYQVQEALGVARSEVPEVSISQIAFEASCACTTITFEMAPALMTEFQDRVNKGFTVNVGGRTVAFYSIAVMTVVDGQMVVAAPSSGGGMCFSGDSEVLTKDGYVAIKDLQEHDRVAVLRSNNGLRFEPIWWYIHKVADQEADFKVIETELGNTIEITPLHLIPVVPCDIDLTGQDMETVFKQYSVFAGKVEPGQCLMTLGDKQRVQIQQVAKVGDVRKTGYYSPLTNSGTILVDDIAASCYSQIESHSLQQITFTFIRHLTRMFSSNAFVSNVGGQVPKMLNLLQHAGMWLTSA